jgi:L-alanine-DL-glutamate epimerase-like enolase superfamily enzyme
MRLIGGTVYALAIPFVEAFAHSAAGRAGCDSVVVRVVDDAGTEGFGEGVPRPYVTGETVDGVLAHLRGTLWPAIAGRALPALGGEADLYALDAVVPARAVSGWVADGASRAALELAIVDCALKRRRWPLGRLLRARRRRVVYSGVIPQGSTDETRRHARRMKLVGFGQIKIKLGGPDDVERVRAVREIVGPAVSLRVDANGAWTPEQALAVARQIAPFDVAVLEEPLGRGAIEDLRRLRDRSPIPLMVDESLVTLADAEALIAARATDYFNVRVSKHGGLARSLEIARWAGEVGIGVQVGSHVGETAILAAAGRHLAAALDEVAFVEGSYGTLLLLEDVAAEAVRFGHRGVAPVLTGPGLGIRVLEDRLRRLAHTVVELDARGGSSCLHS